MLFLTNKKPSLNHGNLVLNYINRNVVKSVKNYQLCEKGENSIYYQFGKTGQDSFFFDFKYPFTPIQSFGIAISSLHK